MEIQKISCPSCGATIEPQGHTRIAFCPYCGSKLAITYDNEHVIRTIDEAKLAENELEMRRLEIEAREREQIRKQEDADNAKDRKMTIAGYIFAAISAIAGGIVLLVNGFDDDEKGLIIGSLFIVIGLYVAFFNGMSSDSKKKKRNEQLNRREGKIKIPGDMDYPKMGYNAVETTLRSLGFYKIQSINLEDLRRFDIKKKEGLVASIKINGEYLRLSEWYNKDDSIVVNYHGYAKK